MDVARRSLLQGQVLASDSPCRCRVADAQPRAAGAAPPGRRLGKLGPALRSTAVRCRRTTSAAPTSCPARCRLLAEGLHDRRGEPHRPRSTSRPRLPSGPTTPCWRLPTAPTPRPSCGSRVGGSSPTGTRRDSSYSSRVRTAGGPPRTRSPTSARPCRSTSPTGTSRSSASTTSWAMPPGRLGPGGMGGRVPAARHRPDLPGSDGTRASYMHQFAGRSSTGPPRAATPTSSCRPASTWSRNAETVLPTWYLDSAGLGSTPRSTTGSRQRRVRISRRHVVLGTCTIQAADSDRWMTSHSGPISSVAVLDRPVSWWNRKLTQDIRNFLTRYTRYENFFAYGNQLMLRADYERLGSRCGRWRSTVTRASTSFTYPPTPRGRGGTGRPCSSCGRATPRPTRSSPMRRLVGRRGGRGLHHRHRVRAVQRQSPSR